MPPPHDTSVQPDALPDAMLLAITGGLLDAVVYLNHGHVFANAMSGNVIFLGIAIIGRDWGDIVPHLVPLAGFFSGVLTSKHLRARMGIHSVLLGLALEIVAIFVLGWLPIGFPHMAFTTIIAYVIPYTGAISQPGESILYTTLVGEGSDPYTGNGNPWLFYVHAPSGPTGLMLWLSTARSTLPISKSQPSHVQLSLLLGDAESLTKWRLW